MKGIALAAGILLFAFGIASATDELSAPSLTPQETETVDQARNLLKRARTALQSGELDSAEKFLTDLLSLPAPKAEKRDGLLELGHLLEDKLRKPVKAAAVYEQLLSLFPNDAEAPNLSLRLGRIYRNLGAYKTAQSKFYNVLNAALRVADREEYKDAALRAQIEIAHTHFDAGEYAEAAKFYTRLKRIEMPGVERSDVYFRSAFISYLSKDYSAALSAAREFLTEYPESAMLPECQYLIVRSLKALSRHEEALQETLKLLRAGKKHGAADPETWAYWQQKTGNELANELYAKGDAFHALTIYQTLAEISEAPEWRWPAVYQIGLCFERLRHPERALEAYRFILNSPVPEQAGPLGLNLGTLREMAQWRADHVSWLRKSETDLVPLFGKKLLPKLPDVASSVSPATSGESVPK